MRTGFLLFGLVAPIVYHSVVAPNLLSSFWRGWASFHHLFGVFSIFICVFFQYILELVWLRYLLDRLA